MARLSFQNFASARILFLSPFGKNILIAATIYAVKNAGLAIGIGVGSSFIVLVSFTWGIFVFEEHVHSRKGACFAVGCMMMGLLGMAYYSAPTTSSDDYQEVHRDDSAISDDYHGGLATGISPTDELHDEDGAASGGFVDEPVLPSTESADVEATTADDDDDDEDDDEDDDIVIVDETLSQSTTTPQSSEPCSTHVICCGMKWQRRTLGILSAMFTGIYGGSIMVPMKWAPADDKGVGYVISFSIGATLVTVALWIFRYLYLCQRHCSFTKAYYALPSFHFRKMWLYGGTCGLLWSIGNFFSIISVEYLGEGVGYSVVQSSMLGMYVPVVLWSAIMKPSARRKPVEYRYTSTGTSWSNWSPFSNHYFCCFLTIYSVISLYIPVQ
jgi:hypothetical protein